MYNFEKLQVWQEAMRLTEIIYQLTTKLPKEERFALVDQLKRAVTSIVLNISEGSGSPSKKTFASFLEIAKGSLFETISILKLLERLFKVDCTKELVQADLVNRLLHGLIKSIKSDNQ